MYHKYVLLYVDYCLVISDRAESMIRNEIGEYFCFKEESIEYTCKCLGGNLREVVLENGSKAWDFGYKQYVKATVNNIVD